MGEHPDVTRRGFLGTTAAAAAFVAAVGSRAHAQGMDNLRIGLIGCGGRGTGAVRDALAAAAQLKINAKVVALGDMFKDRLDGARQGFQALGAQQELTPERCFVGFDAYKKVIDSDINYVLLATPPGWRPLHLEYAVEKGKHVFFEKPCAVDPVGVRRVLAAAAKASEKKLAVVAGTLYRHSPCYRETVKRVHDGFIGDITAGQVYYNTGFLWSKPRQPEWSDAEYQLRNWYYMTWLSGDFNVEQHVHNLDVMHWIMGGPPVKCTAVGGRQVRTAPEFGHIYDHFVTDYEYENGVHIMSSCRQQGNTTPKNANSYIGTKGRVDPSQMIWGANPWKFDNPQVFAGYVLEHVNAMQSMLAGDPVNEAKQQAESSLIGIMARMSAYTGKEVTWDFAMNKSELDTWPEEWRGKDPSFGPMAEPAVAMPGKTPLV
ncbi:MAG: Gfo/Idh/MocA family oxidoreductase [Armatimonadetes bacterium]|nr:Gfo/Idh/MocA family oxidoreductase [Armatimonadota bacterium]